jgi:hypothetical protein
MAIASNIGDAAERVPCVQNVRFGSSADIGQPTRDVRFTPKADMRRARSRVRYVPSTDIDGPEFAGRASFQKQTRRLRWPVEGGFEKSLLRFLSRTA